MIAQAAARAVLLCLSAEDLLCRQVRLRVVALLLLWSLPAAAARNGGAPRLWLADLSAGTIFLIVSALSAGQLGEGDGLVLLGLGLLLGYGRTFAVLLPALFLCGAAGAIRFALRGSGGKEALPFLPFLTLSDLLILFAE